MTAIPELVDSTLSEPRDNRMLANPAGRKRISVHAPDSQTLYQHLELDNLLDEFVRRLRTVVEFDELVFHQQQIGPLVRGKPCRADRTYKLRYSLDFHGEDLGALVIGRDRQFHSSEVRRIRLYVDSLIGPLNNAVRYLQVWQSAYQDALTGIRNRASLDLVLSDTQKQNNPVRSLLVCDVDRFKSINDRYGHAVGDEVLRHLARVLQKQTADSGTVYRYGGDEFVVTLDTVFADGGKQLAERLRLAASDLMLKIKQHEIRVTITIGLSQVRAGESLDEVFLRADSALLVGKRQSRDAVICE